MIEMEIEAVILGNGDYPSHPYPLDLLQQAPYVVCCDGAANEYIHRGHTPDAIIGDGDSLSAENKKKFADDASRKDFIDRGVLYTSGMIAGEGLVGILLAVFAVVGLNFDFSGIYGGSFETVGAIVGVIAFAALLGSMMYFCKGKKKQNA